MSDYLKPLYLPQVRLIRFVIYLLFAFVLFSCFFMPFGVYLVCIQIGLICLGMALYQWWEYSRLTSYKEMCISDYCVLYKDKGEELKLMFSDIAVTFLYYSSIDKEKGCATLCLKLINGKTYRFCGIQQVDHLLPKIKLEVE